MSPQPDDRELEDFLARRSSVSREYPALGAEEPPGALDAQILAQAAAAARPKTQPRRRALWWLRPAALVAIIVLSLSLVLRLGEMPAPRSARVETSAPAVPVMVLPPAVQENMQPPSPVIPMEPRVAMAPAPLAEAEQSARAAPPAETVTATTQKPAVPAAPPQLVGGLGTAELRAQQFATDATAEPALKPDAVKRILEAIEARLAPAQPQVESPADARLREIVALSRAGQEEALAAALARFARDFPDDSISALVRAPAE